MAPATIHLQAQFVYDAHKAKLTVDSAFGVNGVLHLSHYFCTSWHLIVNYHLHKKIYFTWCSVKTCHDSTDTMYSVGQVLLSILFDTINESLQDLAHTVVFLIICSNIENLT